MPEEPGQSPSFDHTAALKERGPSLQPGRELGRSRVVSYLGRGGMGEVYEVEHLSLGKRFALKVILPELARDADFVERFEREARVTARLEHPNIVRVDDFGEENGLYWLRMELAGGVAHARMLGPGYEGRARSLAELSHAAGGRLPAHLVVELAGGMLEGLACAHAQGVVHRDLKPGNVLLVEDSRGEAAAKVSDFGLARVVGEGMLASLAEFSMNRSLSAGPTEASTAMASLVGTYEYMSPEQRRGEEVGPVSDVYAAGLVVYRLLTGRQSPGFKRPSEVVRGLDPFWDGFLERALEEEPAKRFADGSAMLASLGERFRRETRGRVSGARAKDALAEALAARTEARRLQARAREMPERSEPALARLIEEAEAELSRGEAAQGEGASARAFGRFERAKELFESAFKGAKALAECAKCESETRRAEGAAREVRADGFAPADFDAAMRAAEEAVRARNAGEFERACRLYGEAERAFELARETAGEDAALRSEVLSLQSKASSWKHRDEPALKRMLDGADEVAANIEDALSRRESAKARELAGEAKRLYEDAFAKEDALEDCARREREEKKLLNECLRRGAERIAPKELAEGRALIEQASAKRTKGDFEAASGDLVSAHVRLCASRDACENVRATRLSGLGLKVAGAGVALVAVLIGASWFLFRGAVLSVAVSPDARYLATGSDDKTAGLWDIRTGKRLVTFSGHADEVCSVALSRNGRYLATGSADRTAALWDIRTGKKIRAFEGHRNRVHSVAFSPSGRSLATGSADGTAALWEVRTGKRKKAFEGHGGEVHSVSFSPDGRRLATGSADGTAVLWDVRTGKRISTYKGHAGPVCSVAFSPDGRTLATGSRDNTARLWNVSAGERLAALEGHKGDVNSVSFSGDGRLLATGSRDGTAALWDVRKGSRIAVFEGHRNAVVSVAFSPDGRYLVTGGLDRTARIWPLQEELPPKASGRR